MKITDQQERVLQEMLASLRNAAGENLESLVLFGSAAGDEFEPGVSNLNLLCLVRQLDADVLRQLAPVMQWWSKQKQPEPMLFTIEELRNSADVFAIELYDIQRRHRVLFGADHFHSLAVPMNLHGVELERELRVNLIKLRQQYLAINADAAAVQRLMTGSMSTFLTLFRHTLIAFGRPDPEHKREVIERLQSLFQFDPAAIIAVLELRQQKDKRDAARVHAMFARYLEAVERITNEVDRRLA